MKKYKKALGLILILSLLFLTACKNNGGNIDNPVEEPQDPNPALKKGNQLVVAVDPWDFQDLGGRLSPIHAKTVDFHIVNTMFEGLMTTNLKGQPEKSLAEDYIIDMDKKEITFRIRKGVKFHNDRELTAEDVAYTYLTIASPRGNIYNTYPNYVYSIAGAEDYRMGETSEIHGIVLYGSKEDYDNLTTSYVDDYDPYKITFKYIELDDTTVFNHKFGIIQRYHYESLSNGQFPGSREINISPMGTGPFMMESFSEGEECRLKAFKNYWKDAPKIDSIKYIPVEGDNLTQGIKDGSLDIADISNLLFLGNRRSYTSPKHTSLLSYLNPGYTYVGFNMRSPKVQDKRVRQALTYGLDRESFVDDFLKGRGVVANLPMLPGSDFYPLQINEYNYDVQKAKELLDEAGWMMESDGYRYKEGEKLTLTLYHPQDVMWSDVWIQWSKQNWKDIGVELNTEENHDHIPHRLTEALESGVELWSNAWSIEREPSLDRMFSKYGTRDLGEFYDERIEKLLDVIASEDDFDKRKAVYQEIGSLINEELPYIFIYHRQNNWSINDRVKNFHLSFDGRWSYNAHLIEVEH